VSLPSLAALALLALATPACTTTSTPASDGVTSGDGMRTDGGGAADARTDTVRGEAPGPAANVYRSNPVDDQKKTTRVLLQSITDPKGLLVGSYVNVWNCINAEGGQKINLNLGTMAVSGSLCKLTQKVKPGADGSYLQYVPPASDIDGGDSFAEIMMYHHVTTIADHYKKTFGLTAVDKPIRAIVNVQGFVDMFGKWVGVPNAAYIPKDGADQLKQLFGIDILNGEEGIVFGYNNLVPSFGDVNFSFEAAVIYHEFTHRMVGGNRLMSPAVDKYGVDPTPKGINEGIADYMACSFLENPMLGAYSLGSQARDLTRSFKCPDHVVGEEHVDGEIFSGALWEARGKVGAKVLDPAIWKALLGFTASTNFLQAGLAIVDEVKQAAPGQEAVVQKIFEDHGVIGCVRLRDHVDYDAGTSGYAPSVEGKGTIPLTFNDTGVPGAMQYRVALLDTTKEVVIEYRPLSGGMMGMGGTKGDASVALRKGSEAITWDFAGGKTVSTAQVVLKGADDTADANGYRLVLTGNCISKGDLVLQFINNGLAPASITRVKITQSPTTTATTPNFDLCK